MARRGGKPTDEEIRSMFLDSSSSDGSDASDDSRSSSEDELPANLLACDRTEEEPGDETDDDGGPNRFPPEDETDVFPSGQKWSSTPFIPSRIPFDDSKAGVKTTMANPSEAECFKLFLDETLMESIVEETNRYAQDLKRKTVPGAEGKLVSWTNTTASELYAFLVTAVLMGMVKKSTLREYWSTDPMLQTPFFSSLFSQDRFLLLLRALHFANNATADTTDALYKLRPVLESLRKAFGRVFSPHKDLCIDESLMLWKGRLAFKQYIPSKRNRFGVKLFVMCDVATGFVQDLIVYTGASSGDVTAVEGLGLSGSVVATLMRPYLWKGHTVFTDNWYSSPTLFAFLLRRQTGACGTVRANRKGMPTFRSKMSNKEVDFKHNGDMLAVKWRDKRDVHMLSTVHKASMSENPRVDRATGERKRKPDCMIEYNVKMGAMDKSDMMNSFVESTRKSLKWYRKVFFHLLDVAILNAFVVHRQLTGLAVTYKQFRLNLMRQLLEEHHSPRPRPSTGGRPPLDSPVRLTARHFPEEIPPTEAQGKNTRRTCKVCKNTKRGEQRKQLTKFICMPCNAPLCPTPCFEEYHTLKHY